MLYKCCVFTGGWAWNIAVVIYTSGVHVTCMSWRIYRGPWFIIGISHSISEDVGPTSNQHTSYVIYLANQSRMRSHFSSVNVRIISQQTRVVEQMLVECWPSVEDDGPTVNQHWFNVSCLLGFTISSTTAFQPMMFCCSDGQRRRRWANIKTALAQRLFAVKHSACDTHACVDMCPDLAGALWHFKSDNYTSCRRRDDFLGMNFTLCCII